MSAGRFSIVGGTDVEARSEATPPATSRRVFPKLNHAARVADAKSTLSGLSLPDLLRTPTEREKFCAGVMRARRAGATIADFCAVLDDRISASVAKAVAAAGSEAMADVVAELPRFRASLPLDGGRPDVLVAALADATFDLARAGDGGSVDLVRDAIILKDASDAGVGLEIVAASFRGSAAVRNRQPR